MTAYWFLCFGGSRFIGCSTCKILPFVRSCFCFLLRRKTQVTKATSAMMKILVETTMIMTVPDEMLLPPLSAKINHRDMREC